MYRKHYFNSINLINKPKVSNIKYNKKYLIFKEYLNNEILKKAKRFYSYYNFVLVYITIFSVFI